jgi:hypothetical protein
MSRSLHARRTRVRGDDGGRKGESGSQVRYQRRCPRLEQHESENHRAHGCLKADVTEAKHERDVKRAESRADRLEWEAGFAIDYFIASIEQANLAVLDAIDGRFAAEETKQA